MKKNMIFNVVKNYQKTFYNLYYKTINTAIRVCEFAKIFL